MIEWLRENQMRLEVAGVISAIFFVATLLMVPVLVARIPDDYFVRSSDSVDAFRHRHPALRLLFLVAKNLLGILFLIGGVVMLVLPGQGLMTILLGLILINFPGKRRIELSLVRRPAVLNAINWMRHRSGRSDLRVDGTNSQ